MMVQGQPAVVKVGSPVLLVDKEINAMSPRWAPDGLRIAYTSSHYNGISVYNVEDTSITSVTNDPSAGFGMTWSPDGRYLAARISRFANKRRSDAVAVYTVSTGERQLLSDYDNDLSGAPRWLADNQGVYLDGNRQFRVFRMIDSNNAIGALNEVITYRKRDKLYQRRLDSGIDILISTGDNKILYQIPSPDHSRIVYKTMEGNLWVAGYDGSNPIKLGPGSDPSWHPDGSRLVFAIITDDGHQFTSADIYIINADGSNKVNLTATPGILEMHPDWSPDGKWIAFDTYNTGQIWLQEVR